MFLFLHIFRYGKKNGLWHVVEELEPISGSHSIDWRGSVPLIELWICQASRIDEPPSSTMISTLKLRPSLR